MSVSDEILKRMADSYRRMRNTLRFLLGNLHGFDPARHGLPAAQLLALDRWCSRARAPCRRKFSRPIATTPFI